MKKLIAPILFFYAFQSKAQTDTTEIEMDSVDIVYIKLPDSTGIGAPDGKLVNKEIGISGGTITSDDGKVELIFPEGALKATTTIGIQPVTNLIPNGNGKAYQFEPSGTQFQKPVEIIFHYTAEEASTCPPELKFMALQDHKGKWEYINYDNWDSTGKTLKGFISHFSAFLDGNLMELDPTDKTLKVGESFDLSLTVVAAPGEDELAVLPSKLNSGRKIIWSVKGGARFGTISRQTNQYFATYTAPKSLPESNAKVILKVNETTIREVVQRSRKSKLVTRIPTTKNLATFTCNVNLYDEYKIDIKAEGKSILDCGAEISDKSSFEVMLYPDKKPEFRNIQNEAPTLTKKPGCKPLRYTTDGCLGPIDLRSSEVMGWGITYPPIEVILQFRPVILKIVNFTDKGPNELHDFPHTDIDLSIGNKIKFKPDRTSQTYNSTESKCNLVITITPL